MQENPVFAHPYSEMLQENCLQQHNILVDHSTLKNKFIVHNAPPARLTYLISFIAAHTN